MNHLIGRQLIELNLRRHSGAAVFELHIIPQTDPVKMPVEDPTVRWQSEPVPVATIKIAPQTFDTAERMKECENASFDPWHATEDFRPLGNMMRARRQAYRLSGIERASAGEPDGSERFD